MKLSIVIFLCVFLVVTNCLKKSTEKSSLQAQMLKFRKVSLKTHEELSEIKNEIEDLAQSLKERYPRFSQILNVLNGTSNSTSNVSQTVNSNLEANETLHEMTNNSIKVNETVQEVANISIKVNENNILNSTSNSSSQTETNNSKFIPKEIFDQISSAIQKIANTKNAVLDQIKSATGSLDSLTNVTSFPDIYSTLNSTMQKLTGIIGSLGEKITGKTQDSSLSLKNNDNNMEGKLEYMPAFLQSIS